MESSPGNYERLPSKSVRLNIYFLFLKQKEQNLGHMTLCLVCYIHNIIALRFLEFFTCNVFPVSWPPTGPGGKHEIYT